LQVSAALVGTSSFGLSGTNAHATAVTDALDWPGLAVAPPLAWQRARRRDTLECTC
jgi:hypothetical protein